MKVKLSSIRSHPDNPRVIKDSDYQSLKKSIILFPEMQTARPMVVNSSNQIIGGNQRRRAFQDILGMSLEEISAVIGTSTTPIEPERVTFLIEFWDNFKTEKTVEVHKVDWSEAKQKEFMIKDNVSNGDWDYDVLANDWDSLELNDWGVGVWEQEDKEKSVLDDYPKKVTGDLQSDFVVPPLSILDTQKGYWRERKQFWKSLIGDNGETRENTLTGNSSKGDIFNASGLDASILDPVLAELVIRWFGLKGCKTFDCFAGDSVFGYVSSYTDNEFVGIEIREEQVVVNNARVNGRNAKYICDDGRNVLNYIEENSQDLLFSCPPYFDLEVYSDLPNDASNQKEYCDFVGILKHAFTNAVKCLKENRFAVIVVGDIRDKKGLYRDFCGDIKIIMREAGCGLYNELILAEEIGARRLVARKYMRNRKVPKVHQNVLVFYKGDPKQIKQYFPVLELSEDYESEDVE